MANEDLLRTLQETRQKVVAERSRQLQILSQRQQTLDTAKVNLRGAQDREREAVRADEEMKAKIKDTGAVRGPLYRPQAEQTHLRRSEFAELARSCQAEFVQSETRLAAIQSDLERTEKDLAELDAQIRQLRGS